MQCNTAKPFASMRLCIPCKHATILEAMWPTSAILAHHIGQVGNVSDFALTTVTSRAARVYMYKTTLCSFLFVANRTTTVLRGHNC